MEVEIKVEGTVSDDLKKFLIELEFISDNMGIYPAAMKGCGEEHDYEQRDGYKNGWNACVMEYGSKISAAVYSAQEKWSEEEHLFAADTSAFHKMGDQWGVFLNDTWYYACADWEPIPKEKYNEVAKWYKDWGWGGLLYWVYLQRKHEPQVESALKRFRVVQGYVEGKNEVPSGSPAAQG